MSDARCSDIAAILSRAPDSPQDKGRANCDAMCDLSRQSNPVDVEHDSDSFDKHHASIVSEDGAIQHGGEPMTDETRLAVAALEDKTVNELRTLYEEVFDEVCRSRHKK